MKSALVHDWLVGIGGGEKCLEAIYELFPSPIATLVRDDKKIQGMAFAAAECQTSFIQKMPRARTAYRNYLPLFPLAIEQLDLTEYDLVISLSHAVAKGALTHAEQLHLCYCFTPMRYAWDLTHQYLAELGAFRKICARLALHYLRSWDIASSSRVDHFAAISHVIARRIQKIYGREATVIYPPVATHKFAIAQSKEEYYLTASRLVPYKKIDLIVEAFAQMPDKRLVVIGDGPEMQKIKSRAAKNIEILGYQSDAVLNEHLAKAKAFVFAAEEDFGIIVVEAQAAGTPVIAFGKGGSLETVVEDKTGLFFPDQTVESLIVAVEDFEKRQGEFDPQGIKAHAEFFNEERFKRQFHAFVKNKVGEFHESHHSSRRQRDPSLAHL
ncbi:MAG: glycosyltransferase [Chlamydiales bacterium]|nr:glycosyltransferase [Chlamydiales bacterium]